ncbi:sensor histidine kinase [Actinomyces sp. zg-332]|uniref:sensor histidine kinase n=1 Tax=Actinomyces sp. zg-332 TaxID=2708340 RepID=UPI0018C1E0FB|nr:sensor histidine kinase [Actinomyces sp. zg-332]QPK93610.1 sensor histidine kinase [Actinomyces sp. zg-332]
MWHYKDKLSHPRYIVFFVLGASITIYMVLKANLESAFFIIAVYFICIAMIFIQRGLIRKEKIEKQLWQQNMYINQLIAENERNRIGRDLHDTLGHLFATMSLKSELALKLFEKNQYDKAEKELVDLNALTKNAMGQVRQVVSGLKYQTVESELVTISQTLELAGISLEVLGEEKANILSPTMQSTISMIVRELSNNVIKHSKAKSCSLSFYETDTDTVVDFSDNGIGFETLVGNELKSIKDRLVLVKGKVKITSIKNPTNIVITIPFEKE